MSDEAFGPVRLVTDDTATAAASVLQSPQSATSIAGWTIVGIGLAIVVVVVGFHAMKWWRARSVSGQDEAAAKMLAKRMGLSKRDRAVLDAMASGGDSPLDLLVSVKKFTVAATRHAGTLSNAADREALADLCRALDAEVPESLTKAAVNLAGTRQTPAGARRPARPSVVSPRLIDRRG